MKLPLEILREKYIPVTDFPDRFNISEEDVRRLISKGKLRIAEFKAPGDNRRTTHVNYEEVLSILQKEENS